MLGVTVGVLATLLAIGQAREPAAEPAPASPSSKVWRTFDVNGVKAPFLGHETKDKAGPLFRWDAADQRWNVTSPFFGECPTSAARLKKRYTIKVNGVDGVPVTGWVDGEGVFRWCWDDQAVTLIPNRGAGAVNPMTAMANGVDVGKLDGPGVVRASDPDTAAEVRTVMEAAAPESPCRPDTPSCPSPSAPDLPASGLNWWLIAGGVLAVVLVFGLPAVVVLAIGGVLILRRWRRP